MVPASTHTQITPSKVLTTCQQPCDHYVLSMFILLSDFYLSLTMVQVVQMHLANWVCHMQLEWLLVPLLVVSSQRIMENNLQHSLQQLFHSSASSQHYFSSHIIPNHCQKVTNLLKNCQQVSNGVNYELISYS